MRRLRSLSVADARGGELVVERDPGRPSGRLLRDRGMDSSYVDLSDPTYLDFDYMRWLRIALRHARARRILHVGGGACALARALAAEDPDGRQEVCEIDADVIAVARDHFGLRRAPGLHVRHADGREFIATQPDHGWDAIVIDAFLAAQVPKHLITVEALADAGRVAPLVLVNVVDDRSAREIAAIAASLSVSFEHVWALGARAGNTIVGGQRVPPERDRLSALAAADSAPPQLIPADRLAQMVAASPIRRDPSR
jgi:protein-L-isoaspartate O-methyltransferase